VVPLGIRVTIVEPRSNSGPISWQFACGRHKVLEDYDQHRARMRAGITARNGNQPGDPFAQRSIHQSGHFGKILRFTCFLRFAYQHATGKLDNLRKEFETWRDVTLGMDFSTDTLLVNT